MDPDQLGIGRYRARRITLQLAYIEVNIRIYQSKKHAADRSGVDQYHVS